MKKLLTLFMSLALVFSLSLGAFAVDFTPSAVAGFISLLCDTNELVKSGKLYELSLSELQDLNQKHKVSVP